MINIGHVIPHTTILWQFLPPAFLFLITKNFNSSQDHIFLIKEGQSFNTLKRSLEDLKITFPFVIDLFFYISSADKSLRKGEYLIDKKSDLLSLSIDLANGKVFYRTFYIPEGSVLSQFLSDKEKKSFEMNLEDEIIEKTRVT